MPYPQENTPRVVPAAFPASTALPATPPYWDPYPRYIDQDELAILLAGERSYSDAHYSIDGRGNKGDPGSSAYQIAVANGYVGTETQWIASLRGATGPAPIIVGTSVTSTAIVATGTKIFTTQPGLSIAIGAYIRVSSVSTPAAYMAGVVAGYSGSSLTITVLESDGSTATYASWNIQLTGVKGNPGAQGIPGSLTASSTSSVTIGNGTRTFTIPAGLPFVVGSYVRAANTVTPAFYVSGVVTAYSGTTLTMLVDDSQGSGTLASWTLALSGSRGVQGAAGSNTVTTTSASAVALVSSGVVTLTVEAGISFLLGAYVRITSIANTQLYMAGVVTSYSGTTLTVNIAESNGTGTFDSWTVQLAGRRGPQGLRGLDGSGFTWRGQITPGTAYLEGDVVQNEGSSFYVTAGHTADVLPTSGTPGDNYEPMALRGAAGAAGTGGGTGTGTSGSSGPIAYQSRIVTGTAIVGTNVLGVGIPFPAVTTLIAVQVVLGSAPTGSPLVVKVKYGSKLLATVAVPASSTNTTLTLARPYVIPAGSAITFDITQIGSGAAGSNIMVALLADASVTGSVAPDDGTTVAAPTALLISATAGSAGSGTITVTRTSGGLGTDVAYTIYRGTTPTGTPFATSFPFTDTGLAFNTSQSYVATATTAGGSVTSNVVSATPTATAPTALSITSSPGDGRATITASGGVGVGVSYALYRGTAAIGTPISTSFPYIDINLTNSTPVSYIATARNVAGTVTSNVTTTTPVAPVSQATTEYPAQNIAEPSYKRVYASNLPTSGTINAAFQTLVANAVDGDCITLGAAGTHTIYTASGNLDVNKSGITFKCLGQVTINNTNATYHGFRIREGASRVQMRGFSKALPWTLKTIGASGRGDQNQQGMTSLLLDPGCDSFVGQDLVFDGAKAAGVFMYRATNFTFNRCHSQNSLADAWHTTNGSVGGLWLDCSARNPGDDLMPFVHYDPADSLAYVSHDHKVIRFRGEGGGHGRGLAVINCYNIYAEDIYIEKTSAAGIIIGREVSTTNANPSQGVYGIRVNRFALVACNKGQEDHGSILVINSSNAKTVEDVYLKDGYITDTNLGRASGFAGQATRQIVYGGGTLKATMENLTFFGQQPADLYGGNITSTSSLTRINWVRSASATPPTELPGASTGGTTTPTNPTTPTTPTTTETTVARSAQATTAGRTATTLSATLPSAPTNGRLLITTLSVDKTVPSPVAPSGWTLGASWTGTAGVGLAWAWKISSGSETGAITWSWGAAGGAAMWVGEFTLTSPVLANASIAGTETAVNDRSIVSPSATTSGVRIALGAIDTAGAGASPASWPSSGPTWTGATQVGLVLGSVVDASNDNGGASLAIALADGTPNTSATIGYSYTGQSDQQALIVASFTGTVSTTTTPVTVTNPFANSALYANPNSSAKVAYNAETNAYRKSMLKKVSDYPTAEWIGDWMPDPQSPVNTIVTAAVAANQLPLLVLYAIPFRDLGSYSGGGLASAAAYKTWIDKVKAGINGRKCVVIIEPDALPQSTAIPDQTKRTERYDLLKYAVTTLQSSTTTTYLDIGNSTWRTVNDAISLLQTGGVAGARGFSTNTANFNLTPNEIAYANSISSGLGGKTYVIDTSRNGLGPPAGTGEESVINPDGRALGARPLMLKTDEPTINAPLLDANLWIKKVGESDGNRNGAPAAGTFYPDYAIGLAERSQWKAEVVAGDTTPPSAPTSFTGARTSATQVTLTWDAASDNVGVIGYFVHRAVQGGTPALVATLGNVLSYTDNNLVSTTGYYYELRARDAAGNTSTARNVSVGTTVAGGSTTPVSGTTNSDTFSGTAGTAPDSTKWYLPHDALATATINSGGAFLVSNGNFPMSRMVSKTPTAQNHTLKFTYWNPNTGLEAYFAAFVRGQFLDTNAGKSDYRFESDGGGNIQLARKDANGNTVGLNRQTVIPNFSGGTKYRVELSIEGTTLSVYVWNLTTGTKPTTPTLTVTDAALTTAGYAGFTSLGVAGGGYIIDDVEHISGTGTTATPTTPAQPVISATATTTATTATISWGVSTPGQATVTGWDNGRNGVDAGGGGAYSTVDPATATARVFDKLLPSTTYIMYVRANTTTGTSNTVQLTLTTQASGGTTAPASSGQEMPIGDLTGWTQTLAQNFTTNAAIGSFASTYQGWGKLDGAYDTSSGFGRPAATQGLYSTAKTVSVNSGIVDIYPHTEGTRPYVAALSPVMPTYSQLYGRYTVRFRSETAAGYKIAWALLPESGVASDGDVSFPETTMGGTIQGFSSNVNGSPQTNAFFVDTARSTADWHTATIEWTPSKLTFILDDQTWSTTDTAAIPTKPMVWTLVTQTTETSTPPSTTSAGHVYIDWVATYKYAPATVPTTPTTPSGSRIAQVGASKLGFNSTVFSGGYDVAPSNAFASWRGRPIDGHLYFAARQTWSDFRGAIQSQQKALLDAGKLVILSLPPAPEQYGTSMWSQVLSGQHDAEWRSFGAYIAAQGWNKPNFVVRLGWEGNGNWYAWSYLYAPGANNTEKAANVAAGYRRVITAIRDGGGTEVRFNQCFNKGASHSGFDFAAFPGKDYVDVIGIDQYDRYGTITDRAGTAELNRTPSLKTVAEFARSKGIQWSIDEWGVWHGDSSDPNGGGDNPLYPHFIWDAVQANRDILAWENTYDDNGAPSTAKHKLSDGQNPKAAATYLSHWSGSAPDGTTTTTPTDTNTGSTPTPTTPTGTFAPARWSMATGATPLVRMSWETGVDLDTNVVKAGWVGSYAPGATQSKYMVRLDRVSATGTVITASDFVYTSPTGTTTELVTISKTLVPGAFYQPYIQVTDSAGRVSALEMGPRFVCPSGNVFGPTQLASAGITNNNVDCSSAMATFLRARSPGDRIKLATTGSYRWQKQDIDGAFGDGLLITSDTPGTYAVITPASDLRTNLRITRPGVILRDLRINVPGGALTSDAGFNRRAQNANDPDVCPFYVEGNLAVGVKFIRCYSKGSMKAGQLWRGNGSNGPSYGFSVDCTVEDSWADAFHATEGSHHITFTRPLAIRPGDDAFADVGYGGNGVGGMPYYITWEDIELVDQTNGRGFSAIGAHHILATVKKLDRPAAAGIYIGAENGMQASYDIEVKASTTSTAFGTMILPNYYADVADLRNPSQNVVNQGAVLMLSNDSGTTQQRMKVTGLTYHNPGGTSSTNPTGNNNDFYLNAISYGGAFTDCSIVGTLTAGSLKRTNYLNKANAGAQSVSMTLTLDGSLPGGGSTGGTTTPTVTQPTITATSSNVTSTTITINWSVTSTGNAAITGWSNGRDGVDAGGGGAYSTVDASSTTSRTFLNLVPNTTYTVFAQAQTASGVSNRVALTVTTAPTNTGSTAGPGSAPTGMSGNWTLDFQEEFDADLSSTKWRKNRYGGTSLDSPFNKDIENAYFDPANVVVANGQMSFVMKQANRTADGFTYAYSSGTVSTNGLYSFGPDTFIEARVYIPTGAGLWPAFWAMPPGNTWPPEFDFFEFFDTSIYSRPQINWHPIGGGQSGPTTYGTGDLRNAFHVYGFYRQGSTVIPYVDGVAYPSATVSNITSEQWYLILNMSLYRNNTPPLTTDSQMKVDWVRTWKPVTTEPTVNPTTPSTTQPLGTSAPARLWIPNGSIPTSRVTYTTGVNSNGRIQVDWVGSMPDSRASTSAQEVNVPTFSQNAFQAYVVDLSSNTTVADSGVVSSSAETWTASSFTPVPGRRYMGYARVRSSDGQWSAYSSTRFVAPSGRILYIEDFGAVADGTTRSGADVKNGIYDGPIRNAMKVAQPGDVIKSKNPGTVLTNITASGSTLTSSTAVFTSAMANKPVIIYGAGSTNTSTNSYCHRANISSVSSDGKSVTLSSAVVTNGTGLRIIVSPAEYWTDHINADSGMGSPGQLGGWTFDGTGCIFTSLNVDSAGFRTQIPDITWRNVHYWQKVTTTRGNGKNNDTGPFFIESSNAVGIRVIGCYAERARDAGFLIYDKANDIHIVDCVADHTNADGFHVTGSAHHVQFIRPLNAYIGDDAVANIGYRSDGDANRPHDIVWEAPRVLGQDWGRGVSFGGCYNCLVTDLYIERGAGASFILGSDADMANTSNVQIRGGRIITPNLKRGTKPTYTQGTGTGSVIPDEPWLKLLNSNNAATRQRDILLENFTVTDGRYIQIIQYSGSSFQDKTIIIRGVTMNGTVNSGTNWLDQSTYPNHIDMRGVSVPSGSTGASAPTASN